MQELGVNYMFRIERTKSHTVQVRLGQAFSGLHVWVDGNVALTSHKMFGFSTTQRFKFTINDDPPMNGVVELKQKRWFGGARPVEVSTYVDGKLIKAETTAPMTISRGTGLLSP